MMLDEKQCCRKGTPVYRDKEKDITTEQRRREHGKLRDAGIHIHDAETTIQKLFTVSYKSTHWLSSQQQLELSYGHLATYLKLNYHIWAVQQ